MVGSIKFARSVVGRINSTWPMVDPNQLRIIGWSTKLRMAIDWPNRLHADDGWPFQLRSIASGRPDYINMATMVGCLNSEPWWLAGSTLYELPTMFLAKKSIPHGQLDSKRPVASGKSDRHAQWLAESNPYGRWFVDTTPRHGQWWGQHGRRLTDSTLHGRW